MKLGQLRDYSKKIFFSLKQCRKRGRKTSVAPLFVFRKALYEVKPSGLQLSVNIF